MLLYDYQNQFKTILSTQFFSHKIVMKILLYINIFVWIVCFSFLWKNICFILLCFYLCFFLIINFYFGFLFLFVLCCCCYFAPRPPVVTSVLFCCLQVCINEKNDKYISNHKHTWAHTEKIRYRKTKHMFRANISCEHVTSFTYYIKQ